MMTEELARLLVVDDEENVRLTLAQVLADRGYQVETASSGREAIERIEAEPFDLVLTDLAMKDVDGIAVLSAVRERLPDAVSIMLTGFASLDTAIEAIRLGAYDYMTKPANLEDMLQTIRRGLRERRLRIELRRRNEELAALNRLGHVGVGRVLQSVRDQWEALAEVARIAGELLAPRGAVRFEVAARGGPRCEAWSATAEAAARLEHAAARALVARAEQSGEALQAAAEGWSCLAAPVASPGNLLGTLLVVSPGDPWTEEQLEAAATIAGRVGTWLEGARLFRRLLSEKETLRLILHATGDGVIGLDGRGRIRFFSRAAARLLGYEPSAVEGRQVEDLSASGELSRSLGALRRRAESAASGLAADESPLKRADGSVLFCDVVCSSLPEEAPGELRWVLAVRDATERLALASERTQAFRHLTHELKSPLVSILAYADLAVSGRMGPLAPPLDQAMAAIGRQGRQLLAMIENVLAATRLTAGGLEYRFERTRIDELAAEARRLMAPLAADRGVSLAEEIEPGLEATIDRAMLAMVFNNLLANALKFTGDGGLVVLRLAAEAQDLLIEVADSGSGIAEEHQQRIFEAHFQSDPSRGGSGLGLWIVQSVVAAHRGSIEVASRPGRGARFTVRLPREGPR